MPSTDFAYCSNISCTFRAACLRGQPFEGEKAITCFADPGEEVDVNGFVSCIGYKPVPPYVTKQSFTTRPGHYGSIAGVDSIRIMESFNFNLGNAMKYIWRCGHKSGAEPVHDLRKAIQYLEFEIARMERNRDE